MKTAQRRSIWLAAPAGNWNEAFPIGNGRIGGMVFGGVAHERIGLNDDTLWSGGPVEPDRTDRSNVLADIRSLVFERRHAEANEAACGLQGPFTQSYLPLGDLLIEMDHAGEPSGYRRELDLGSALAVVRYRIDDVDYERTALASAPDNVIAVRIAASRPGGVSLRASLTSLLRSRASISPDGRLILSGRAPSHVEPNYRNVEPAVVYDESPERAGMEFHAVLDIRAQGAGVRTDGSHLVVEAADSVVLILGMATGYEGFDRLPRRDSLTAARAAVDGAGEKSFEEIASAHVADHRRFFDRVGLDLGEADDASALPADERLRRVREGASDPGLAALYFDFGRYLLIASSRPGTIAANLQGIWNEEVRPPWSSNFTVNINTQMNYWLAEPAHLSELAAPLFDLIDALRVTGRDVARFTYDCGGWCAGHNVDLWARANPVGLGVGSPNWANWQMAGAWLVEHLWEHYAFGLDTRFLRDRAYPALRECAEFLLDHLVESPEGFLVTCPSTSPENVFRSTDESGAAHAVAVTQATTMDRVLIREVFENTISAAAILGLDDDFAKRLQAALSRVPPLEIGDEGQLLEWPAWLDEQDPGHRHISHLYANYPAAVITRSKTPGLSEAVRISLDRRIAAGGGHTGWSRAWSIAQYARLGDAEKAHDSLTVLLAKSTNPNLFDMCPPFQIDGNFGGAAAIVEMLLQSHEGVIELLPALPAAWPTGSFTGLRARGGFTVDAIWRGGVLAAATIHGSPGARCKVACAGRAWELALTGGRAEVPVDSRH